MRTFIFLSLLAFSSPNAMAEEVLAFGKGKVVGVNEEYKKLYQLAQEDAERACEQDAVKQCESRVKRLNEFTIYCSFQLLSWQKMSVTCTAEAKFRCL